MPSICSIPENLCRRSIPAHRNNNNTEWKCQIKRNFCNLYTIFTTTMDVSLCTLANSDYGLPFLVTIYSADHLNITTATTDSKICFFLQPIWRILLFGLVKHTKLY